VVVLNPEYKCPDCAGYIKPVRIGSSFRWTCMRCQRDYGYNTDKPTCEPNWRFLSRKEVEKFLQKMEAKTKIKVFQAKGGVIIEGPGEYCEHGAGYIFVPSEEIPKLIEKLKSKSDG